MAATITLRGSIQYHERFPPQNAKKGYVARIKGRAAGAVKFEREFLGESVSLTEGDEGLYEVQQGDKKGGCTRWYRVVLSHPEHGMIMSADAEGILPQLTKALDAGLSIDAAVEVTNLRPSERTEGLMVFDAVARSVSQAKKAVATANDEERIAAILAALEGLNSKAATKVLAAVKKRIAPSA